MHSVLPLCSFRVQIITSMRNDNERKNISINQLTYLIDKKKPSCKYYRDIFPIIIISMTRK